MIYPTLWFHHFSISMATAWSLYIENCIMSRSSFLTPTIYHSTFSLHSDLLFNLKVTFCPIILLCSPNTSVQLFFPVSSNPVRIPFNYTPTSMQFPHPLDLPVRLRSLMIILKMCTAGIAPSPPRLYNNTNIILANAYKVLTMYRALFQAL